MVGPQADTPGNRAFPRLCDSIFLESATSEIIPFPGRFPRSWRIRQGIEDFCSFVRVFCSLRFHGLGGDARLSALRFAFLRSWRTRQGVPWLSEGAEGTPFLHSHSVYALADSQGASSLCAALPLSWQTRHVVCTSVCVSTLLADMLRGFYACRMILQRNAFPSLRTGATALRTF